MVNQAEYDANNEVVFAEPVTKKSGCGVSVLILTIVSLVAVCGCCSAFMLLGYWADKNTKGRMADADKLYEAGRYAEAVAIYKDTYALTEGEQRDRIVARIISYELKSGNKSVADEWVRRAAEASLSIEKHDGDAAKLVADARKKIEADRERTLREAVKEQPDRVAERNEPDNHALDNEKKMATDNGIGVTAPKTDSLTGEWERAKPMMWSDGPDTIDDVHKRWNFQGDRLTISHQRSKQELRYERQSGSPDRLIVYNEVGDRKIDLFHCIYKFEGRLLIVCVKLGGPPPPSSFSPETIEEFQLTFVRKGEDAPDEAIPAINQKTATEHEESDVLKREAEFRTWKTADGKFSVEARMASFRGDSVSLEKHDGTIVKVAIDKLSDEDKAYIEQVKKTGKR